MQQPLLSKVKRWSLCSFLVLLFLGVNANNGLAQDNGSIDLILVEAAPNLPWIMRTESSEDVFQGEKFNYALTENNDRFQNWIDNFPDEVNNYKSTIETFLKDTSHEDVNESEKDFYHDMKAQYQMIKNLMSW